MWWLGTDIFALSVKFGLQSKKSHDHVIFDGHSVAYANDLLSCGARILPQQSHVVGDSQGQNYSGSTVVAPINNFKSEPMFQYGQKYLLVDDLTAEPLSNVCYEVSKSEVFVFTVKQMNKVIQK